MSSLYLDNQMSEQQSGPVLRYVCPFPGCSRSFRDFWRLKVHYRAPPGARGSGVERGHGQELPFCPLCNMDLREVKYHKCAAGPTAPTGRSRNQFRQLQQVPGSVPLGSSMMMPAGLPYQQQSATSGSVNFMNAVHFHNQQQQQQQQQQHSMPGLPLPLGVPQNGHMSHIPVLSQPLPGQQVPGQHVHRALSMGQHSNLPPPGCQPAHSYMAAAAGAGAAQQNAPTQLQSVWSSQTASASVPQQQQQAQQTQQQQQVQQQQPQQQWWQGIDITAAAAADHDTTDFRQQLQQQQLGQQQSSHQGMQPGYSLQRSSSAPVSTGGSALGMQPGMPNKHLSVLAQQQQQWQQQQQQQYRQQRQYSGGSQATFNNSHGVPQQQQHQHQHQVLLQQHWHHQQQQIQQQQPDSVVQPLHSRSTAVAAAPAGPFNFNQHSSGTVWQGGTAAAAECTRPAAFNPSKPLNGHAATAADTAAATLQQPYHVGSDAFGSMASSLAPINVTFSNNNHNMTGGSSGLTRADTMPSCSSAQSAAALMLSQQQQQQQQPLPPLPAVYGPAPLPPPPQQQDELPTGADQIIADFKAALQELRSSITSTPAGLAATPEFAPVGNTGDTLTLPRQQHNTVNTGGVSSGSGSPVSSDADRQQQQQDQLIHAYCSSSPEKHGILGAKRSADVGLDRQQQWQQQFELKRLATGVSTPAAAAAAGLLPGSNSHLAAAAAAACRGMNWTDTPPPSEAQEALLQLAAVESHAAAAAAGVSNMLPLSAPPHDANSDSHHAAQVSALLGTALAAASSSMKDPAAVVQRLLAVLDDHIALLSHKLQHQGPTAAAAAGGGGDATQPAQAPQAAIAAAVAGGHPVDLGLDPLDLSSSHMHQSAATAAAAAAAAAATILGLTPTAAAGAAHDVFGPHDSPRLLFQQQQRQRRWQQQQQQRSSHEGHVVPSPATAAAAVDVAHAVPSDAVHSNAASHLPHAAAAGMPAGFPPLPSSTDADLGATAVVVGTAMAAAVCPERVTA